MILKKLLTLFKTQNKRIPFADKINSVLKEFCGVGDNGFANVTVAGFYERNDAYLYELKRAYSYPLKKVLAIQEEIQEAFSGLDVLIESNPLTFIIFKDEPDIVLLKDYLQEILQQAKKNQMISVPGVSYQGRGLKLFGLSFKNESFAHVLIDGSTGAGKTVLVKSLLLTLAMLNSPNMCTLVVCDKKGGLDFTDIEGLNHIANQRCFVLDDEIKQAIKQVHNEMMRRITERDLEAMNKHIVLIIDEFHQFADDDKTISLLKDITAMGRAMGVHLVAITQRPDHKSIDTTLRANLVAEFAGRMTRKGSKGLEAGEDAELQSKLPGKGLFLARSATSNNKRVQGFWLDTKTISWLVNEINNLYQDEPHFKINTEQATQTKAVSTLEKNWNELILFGKQKLANGEQVDASVLRKAAPGIYNKQINANTAEKLLAFIL